MKEKRGYQMAKKPVKSKSAKIMDERCKYLFHSLIEFVQKGEYGDRLSVKIMHDKVEDIFR